MFSRAVSLYLYFIWGLFWSCCKLIFLLPPFPFSKFKNMEVNDFQVTWLFLAWSVIIEIMIPPLFEPYRVYLNIEFRHTQNNGSFLLILKQEWHSIISCYFYSTRRLLVVSRYIINWIKMNCFWDSDESLYGPKIWCLLFKLFCILLATMLDNELFLCFLRNSCLNLIFCHISYTSFAKI